MPTHSATKTRAWPKEMSCCGYTSTSIAELFSYSATQLFLPQETLRNPSRDALGLDSFLMMVYVNP